MLALSPEQVNRRPLKTLWRMVPSAMCLLVTTMAFIKPPGHLLELLRQLKVSSQVIKYALEETDSVNSWHGRGKILEQIQSKHKLYRLSQNWQLHCHCPEHQTIERVGAVAQQDGPGLPSNTGTDHWWSAAHLVNCCGGLEAQYIPNWKEPTRKASWHPLTPIQIILEDTLDTML